MATTAPYTDGSYAELPSKPSQPLLSPGLYEARCTDVVVQESTFKDAPKGSKVLKLRWELLKTFEDEQSRERKFVLYSKPVNLSTGEKSSLYKLCQNLTGHPPKKEDIQIERDGKTVTISVFPYRSFIGMTANLLVKNAEHNGQEYSNISDYVTDETQRTENLKSHDDLPDFDK